MAKFLAFRRDEKQVVTVNTIDLAVENLGNSIPTVDGLADFPHRCENLVCQYRGDYYFLYRSSANEIRLAVLDLDAGTWGDTPGFTVVTTASGTLVPLCLHVVRDRLAAVWTLSSSAGLDGVYARRSGADDGTSWGSVNSQLFVGQPTNSRGGASIAWHNAVFFTTSEGLGYYDPTSDTISAVFDSGSDSAMGGQIVNFGAFTFFNGDLYYALPTELAGGSPELYKLDKSWSVSAPLATPAWVNTGIVIPGTGGVVINNDTGNYGLFVNENLTMSMLYSGTLGSKLITIEQSGSIYIVTDLSEDYLSDQIRNEPNLGFGYYVDDRRRDNENHTIIVRFRPAIPQSVILFDWDGLSPLSQRAVLDDSGSGLDLMIPDVERGDFRTFTNNQPSCYIDDVSQPFPGRVRIDYTVQDKNSRLIDVIPEYSIDGQTWSPMSEGDGASGVQDLASSPTGESYFFFWDAFSDLDGDYAHIDVRVVARVSGI